MSCYASDILDYWSRERNDFVANTILKSFLIANLKFCNEQQTAKHSQLHLRLRAADVKTTDDLTEYCPHNEHHNTKLQTGER